MRAIDCGVDALRQDLLQRLRRRHGLARRAPGLERGLAQREPRRAAAQQRRVRRDAENVLQEIAVGDLHVGGKARPRRQRRLQAAAGGMADREPAHRGRRRVMAGPRRRHDQRRRQRVRGLLAVELEQPRGDRGGAERRREIARPDAAIEHARAVDRRAEPDHRLVAHDDGRGEIVRRRRPATRRRWSAPQAPRSRPA